MTGHPSTVTAPPNPSTSSVQLVIDVLGEAIPQGSKTPVQRGRKIVLIEDNPRLKPWRHQVVTAALARIRLVGWRMVDGPVRVEVDFYLPRPPAAARRWRPHVKPDVDKLARAVLDALSIAGVVADDARVVSLRVEKWYAARTVGARVVVTDLTGQLQLPAGAGPHE